MWATYCDAIAEVGGRRVLAVLVVMGLATGLLFNNRVKFESISGVQVIYQGSVNMGPWRIGVPAVQGTLIGFAGFIWVLLMTIVGCPLFVMMLEKGWRELTFAKGTRRWHIFLGRYLAVITLFILIALTTTIPLAARLWWHTGIPTWQAAIAVLILAFSFASLIAAGALTSLAGESVAAPIVASMSLLVLSQTLASRDLLYEYFPSEIGHAFLDWLYYIFPKCMELNSTAASFIQTATISSSWPLWTTGVFIIATMTLTLWLLERKSF
jgi:hypothetical protein